MSTPYAALKRAIQSLSRAGVQLDNARYLADDHKIMVSDLRTMLAYRDQIRQAEKDLGAVLSRLLRLRAPPAASVTQLGPQEPPDDPMIYNRRQADGTFRSLAGFWEREAAPPADEEA